jgi:alpha-L-rhamnosidase
MYPCWKSTYPLIAWYLYQYYGDERVLAEHYDGIAGLVKFLGARADNYIISEGLGDHMEPDRKAGRSNFAPKRTPAAVTSTGYYYFDVWILAQAAEILGKTDDYERYSTLAGKIKNAFNEKFLNKQTNQYATGSQTSNAMALHLGLVPEDRQNAVLKNLVDNIMIKNEGHLSTGILGTNALEQVLGEFGRADVMYEIATKTTYPSWGYTISKGATTVWERFEGSRSSLNMKMFGSTEIFFYRDLAGISHAAPGYKRISIKPRIVGDLEYANASIKTVRGLAAVDWKKDNSSLEMKVTIPVNSEAKVSVPRIGLRNIEVTESDRTIWKNGRFIQGVSGITAAEGNDNYVTFDVGSGSYRFWLKGQK